MAAAISERLLLRRSDPRAGYRGTEAGWSRRSAPTDPGAGLALTEPGAGSDAAAIVTTARRDGGYVLNGSKTWVSDAPDADRYLVYATVAPGSRSRGITTFVVEKGDDGFTLGTKLPKLGTRCCPSGELFFDDCFVADDRRIGGEGQGFRGVIEWFDRSRVLSRRARSGSDGPRSSTRSSTRRSARPSARRSTSSRRCRSDWWTRR